jgi:hypothetical protein
VMKQDRGFNFRYTIDYPVVFTDSTILISSKDTPWLYYTFSTDSDTLLISMDSFYNYPLIAVIDSTPSASEGWSPIIRYSAKTWMRKLLVPFITGADRYADNWYLHYRTYQSLTLEVRNLRGDTLGTLVFPGGTCSDIAGGYLWIGGSYFVEKRNLDDTTLIQRIDLSSQYPFQSYDQIYALAVFDSLIYVVIEDHLLSFNSAGNLVNDVPTLDNIWFMTFVGDKLIAGTNFSTINTVDAATGRAIESYMFPESLYGDAIYPIGGIVDLGDRLAGFRTTPDGIYLYEFTYPQ